MSDIRLGVVGAGNIAKEHLDVIKIMDGVRVEGITSRTLSKAEDLANKYQVEYVCKNVDNLLEKCDLDAIMLLVSANQLYDLSAKLLLTKIPIFIEKPPGLFPDQTRVLVDLADKYGTKNMVGYNRRYYSIFHEGIKIIKNNGDLLGVSIEGHEQFWKIQKLKIDNAIHENWLYANSTHTIDLLRLFGGETCRVNSISKSIKEKNGDQFVSSIEFESGALGTYTSHWFSPGGWSVKLYGENVTVIFKPLENGQWIDIDFNINPIKPDNNDKKYKPGFYGQLMAFCNLLKNDVLEWPGQDLFGSYKTMKLAEKISNA